MTDQPKDDWEDIVAELIDQTQRGQIPWSTFRAESHKHAPTDNVRGLVYEGQYLGRRMWVFEYEYQHWLDEDRSVTETDVAIELLAKNTESTWRVPATMNRRKLLDEARRVTVQADEFAAAVRENLIPF